MFDIVSIGDLLTNYTHIGENTSDISLFERHPAGATSNLLSQCSRLGGRVALITTIGGDIDGLFLYNYIKDNDFDVSGVRIEKSLCTRSVFVYFKENNDRYFSYNNSPITQYETVLSDHDIELVKKAKIFNYPLSFEETDKPIYNTTKKLDEVARVNGVLRAIDANYRGQAFSSELKKKHRETLLHADIIKLSLDEMKYYFGTDDIYEGTDIVLREGNVQLIAVTLDKDGCFLRTSNHCAYMPTYSVSPVDTTGAGDSFFGSLLYQIANNDTAISMLSEVQLYQMADFSNACASYSTMFRGSLAIMGTLNQILEFKNYHVLYPPLMQFSSLYESGFSRLNSVT